MTKVWMFTPIAADHLFPRLQILPPQARLSCLMYTFRSRVWRICSCTIPDAVCETDSRGRSSRQEPNHWSYIILHFSFVLYRNAQLESGTWLMSLYENDN